MHTAVAHYAAHISYYAAELGQRFISVWHTLMLSRGI